MGYVRGTTVKGLVACILGFVPLAGGSAPPSRDATSSSPLVTRDSRDGYPARSRPRARLPRPCANVTCRRSGARRAVCRVSALGDDTGEQMRERRTRWIGNLVGLEVWRGARLNGRGACSDSGCWC